MLWATFMDSWLKASVSSKLNCKLFYNLQTLICFLTLNSLQLFQKLKTSSVTVKKLICNLQKICQKGQYGSIYHSNSCHSNVSDHKQINEKQRTLPPFGKKRNEVYKHLMLGQKKEIHFRTPLPEPFKIGRNIF